MTASERHTWQAPLIEQESRLRRRAVALAKEATEIGVAPGTLASMLGCASRTLREWGRKERQGERVAKPLGRPAVRSPREDRQALVTNLGTLGPRCGVAVFQALHPRMARREVAAMVVRYRTWWQVRNPERVECLQWTVPGAVWTTDHAHVPTTIELPSVALSCRDLASHQQLSWQPCAETAAATTERLAALFEEHGAPLVMKADGGPAFRSDQLQELLRREGVELLPSPPHYPEYNGSCEAANRSMKRRSEHVAEIQGHPGVWNGWDLELARLQANWTTRPWGIHGPVPNERWRVRRKITSEERAAFQAACERLRRGIVAEQRPGTSELEQEHTRRCVQRLAVSRALVAHGLLIVHRRSIRPPISTVRSA